MSFSGYDYGDCGVPVPDEFKTRTCFPGYVFDCSLECVAVEHIRDGTCDDGTDDRGTSIMPNFACVEFYFDFGDCPILSCPDSDEPSVEDCAGNCSPIAAVGDTTCDDGSPVDFNCAPFLYDMLDCELPGVAYIEATLGYTGDLEILNASPLHRGYLDRFERAAGGDHHHWRRGVLLKWTAADAGCVRRGALQCAG